MKTSLRILLLFVILALVGSVQASEIVRINPKFKADAIDAPDPEYPMKSQHLGYQATASFDSKLIRRPDWLTK